ncbi:MAG: hypothetical protein MK135_06520 [Polyangiaceae bacterium]|nr:hypothetical protein [Polyangiaceae bacterium]
MKFPPKKRGSNAKRHWRVPTVLLVAVIFSFRCTPYNRGKGALAVVGAGVVNNASNKSLRFDILKFTLKQFCRELTTIGTPLRLTDDQPVIGRYFAQECESTSLEDLADEKIIVRFSGRGYVWTSATGRIGFEAPGLIELAPDFRVFEDALHVYFRPTLIDTTGFRLIGVESKLSEAAIAVSGVDEAELGARIIAAQLNRGFTAIRYDDGYTDFSLGLVGAGEVPFRPFAISHAAHASIANGRTEIAPATTDLLGAFAVEKGEEIVLSLHLEGAESVEVSIVSAQAGERLLDGYITSGASYRLPSGELVATSHLQREQPLQLRKTVPTGEYFVVFRYPVPSSPISEPLANLPARIDYLLQVGPAL